MKTFKVTFEDVGNGDAVVTNIDEAVEVDTGSITEAGTESLYTSCEGDDNKLMSINPSNCSLAETDEGGKQYVYMQFSEESLPAWVWKALGESKLMFAPL